MLTISSYHLWLQGSDNASGGPEDELDGPTSQVQPKQRKSGANGSAKKDADAGGLAGLHADPLAWQSGQPGQVAGAYYPPGTMWVPLRSRRDSHPCLLRRPSCASELLVLGPSLSLISSGFIVTL